MINDIDSNAHRRCDYAPSQQLGISRIGNQKKKKKRATKRNQTIFYAVQAEPTNCRKKNNETSAEGDERERKKIDCVTISIRHASETRTAYTDTPPYQMAAATADEDEANERKKPKNISEWKYGDVVGIFGFFSLLLLLWHDGFELSENCLKHAEGNAFRRNWIELAD